MKGRSNRKPERQLFFSMEKRQNRFCRLFINIKAGRRSYRGAVPGFALPPVRNREEVVDRSRRILERAEEASEICHAVAMANDASSANQHYLDTVRRTCKHDRIEEVDRKSAFWVPG